MRYFLVILLLTTVARANDFSPLQVDSNNNITATNVSSTGGLTVAGAVGASSSMDGNGIYNIFTDGSGSVKTNWFGKHGGFGGHDYFGNFYVISTNGYFGYSNAGTRIMLRLSTNKTNAQCLSVSDTATNVFTFPTNGSPPQWNGIALSTNSSSGSTPNVAITNNSAMQVFSGPQTMTNTGNILAGKWWRDDGTQYHKLWCRNSPVYLSLENQHNGELWG